MKAYALNELEWNAAHPAGLRSGKFGLLGGSISFSSEEWMLPDTSDSDSDTDSFESSEESPSRMTNLTLCVNFLFFSFVKSSEMTNAFSKSSINDSVFRFSFFYVAENL